jgi:CTP:molybdopterin cytidylyltransferase MocA
LRGTPFIIPILWKGVDVDVVILAAGASRRFGTTKQFTPVTPDGKTLLEVTAGNARGAGCDRAVIVTAPGCEDEVKALFDARPVAGLEVAVATQKPGDLPEPAPVNRDRPWGTAHALWAARDAVTGPFLLFNADDDYGPNAPATLIAALTPGEVRPRFAVLGYPLGTTLSTAGTVSRAVCETDNVGMLVALHEYTAIDCNGRIASGADTGRTFPLDSPVSMNAWAFTLDVFPLLDAALREFLAGADSAQDECYLPVVIDAAVRAGVIEVRVVTAPDRWCGMTWPDDRDRVARRLAERAALNHAVSAFGLDASNSAPAPFGDGLINTSWRVEAAQGPHLLQRLNSEVFPDPVAVAENAAAAAARVDDALRRRGDDDPRHRLVFRDGPDGHPWLRDASGNVWRAAVLVTDARAPDTSRPVEVRAAARELGRFPGLVAEGAGPKVSEILPGFHDTPGRLAALYNRAEADPIGRLANCRVEFDRLDELAPLARRLSPASQPTRLVHNDAKLDNVLVDVNTGEALCVVDLDTVMPGLAVHDFGDLVRSAVTGRPEDEPDLDLVVVRVPAFRDLTMGYLEGSAEWLDEQERSMLVDGGVAITYEQALRFLTDYLAGDSYFPVDDAEHNLRRARAQLRLLEGLLVADDELRRIIDDI